MFIGDSANLSLLRTIRGLVGDCIGSCPFVNDPFSEQMVECAPQGPATWLQATASQPPPKPNYHRAIYLIRRYALATNCVLDLFDEGELLGQLPRWLEGQSAHQEDEVWSPIFFLVFAIGTQSEDDPDGLADIYFNYGRLLTTSYLMEDPSIATLQAYAIITMYLLGACRRNAAFMHLGMAVRAAYALGIHRADIASLFPPAETRTRERLWKVLRTLDLFMSASLGRPTSTGETRETEIEENYSATTDLCAIFEHILNDVYAKRMVTTETIQKVSERHRRWTLRFHHGLEADRINGEDSVEGILPNMGLIHLKEAYYWTIMLLTRPFFVESMARRIAQRAERDARSSSETPSADQLLVHACVNSAICTVDLLKELLSANDVPKRLPFVVNSLFVSGLVLGLAFFGDLYKTYPLDDGLKTIFKVLALFPNDAIARRNLMILEMLFDAANTHVRREKDEAMAMHAHMVSGMFGQMDSGRRPSQSNGTTQQSGMPSVARNTSISPSYQTSDGAHISPGASSQGVSPSIHASTNGPVPGMGHMNMDPGAVLPETAPMQFDLSVAEAMSPRTLWFGSYEENVPLFSTFDTRTFNM